MDESHEEVWEELWSGLRTCFKVFLLSLVCTAIVALIVYASLRLM